MKNLMEQSNNSVNIVGKLLSTTIREGKTHAGKPYESVTAVVRVDQNIEEKPEIDEISVSFFASPYTNDNRPNPMYENVQRLKNMKTVQNVGIEAADTVRLSRGNLQENYYIAKNGQFYDGWQLRGAFVNAGGATSKQMATFNVDIFIMDMFDEVDRDGETTGRLVIKGGIVQYGGKLDVLEFFVEAPDKIDYLQRSWEVNKTVNAVGRIRFTSEEVSRSSAASSWGETIEDNTTRLKKELIITGGSDEPFDDDFGYDPAEIKKGFNIRKAEIEQAQVDARSSSTKPATSNKGKYDWE